MTGPVTASGRDLHTLAAIVSADRGEPPAEGVAPSLLSDLLGLVRCDAISFVGFDSEHEKTWFGQAVPADVDIFDEAFDSVHWPHYWDCQACSYPDWTGDLRSVIKITDIYSTRQWHSTGMYHDASRPYGIEHELMLSLPVGPVRPPGGSRTLRLFLMRGPGPDFSDRDRDLLTVLRPHLHQAYLDAERRRHPAPKLTARHWDLLHLLAAGHTNAQIARRLGISEGTVRTHLEHIYRLLHVSSRTAAVTRAFTDPIGLTPPDPTPGPPRARPPTQGTGLSPLPRRTALSLHSRS